MSNVISLSAFRRQNVKDTKPESTDSTEDVLTFEQLAEKNRKNAERVKRDRSNLNNGVKKSYRLKTANREFT